MPEATTACTICGKTKNTGRDGSLTQFVFRSDTCICDPSVAKFRKKLEEANRVDSEEELPLDPSSFPIERYGPIRELGQGAAGTVYLCNDRLIPGKRVAVKVLNKINAEKLLAFQLEAKATSRLNHPNIITVFDFGATTYGAPFMVMEYLEGSTLDHFYMFADAARAGRARASKTGHVPGALMPYEVVEIFSAVCRALSYAHSNGIFHRDLKPSNILLQRDSSENLRVRLIDFGIAAVKAETQEPTIFQGRTIAGTPNYMSPDTALGKPYDARSEIYSLGCVIYEAVAGKIPLLGASSLETLQLHATTVPIKLIEFDSIAGIEGMRELSAIVSRCLEKNPDARYQSADELAQALQGITIFDTTPTGTADLQENAQAAKRLSLMPLFAVSSVLVMVLAVVIIVFIVEPDLLLSRLEAPSNNAHSALPNAENKGVNASKTEAEETPHTMSQLEPVDEVMPPLEGGALKLEKKIGGSYDSYILQGHVKNADDLKILQGTTVVKRLDLRFDELKGNTLAPLQKLPLERLNLFGSDVDDRSFYHIGKLEHLVQLSLAECGGVYDTGVANLSSLHNLLFLRMGDTGITDKSADTFVKLKQLRELRLSGCERFSSVGVMKLTELKNLETLTIRKCNIDDSCLQHLHKFKALNHLGLSQLNDRTVKYLLNLRITSLSVGDGHQLTDKGLVALTGIKSLKNLMMVPNNNITQVGIATFKAKKPQCQFALVADDSPSSNDVFGSEYSVQEAA